jgi:hypothetical protein
MLSPGRFMAFTVMVTPFTRSVYGIYRHGDSFHPVGLWYLPRR